LPFYPQLKAYNRGSRVRFARQENPLTDTQILTVTIAIVFPALGVMGSIAALLYSNKRLDDMKTGLDKRMDEMKSGLDKRMDDMKSELIRHIDTGFDHMQLLLKLHEAEHHKN
jgi:hypothetical protein